MKPSSVDAGMLINTFARWNTGYEPTITNCYYVATDNLPANQGKLAGVLASDPGDMGSLVVNYDVLTAYAHGILFDGNYYVEVPAITLSAATIFGETKYVTSFYSGTKIHQLPENAKAYTINQDGVKYVFHQIGDDGRVIPKATAVIIVSSEPTVTLGVLNSTTVSAYVGSILHGSDTDITTPTGNEYVLGIVGGTLGFYKFTGSTIPAGKAYLQ